MHDTAAVDLPPAGAELERLVQAQPVAALVVDPGCNRIVAANARAAALYADGELLGTAFDRRLQRRSLGRLIVFVEEIVERGSAWTRELAVRDAAGRALDLEIEGRALKGRNGPLLFLVCHDLEERARRNAEIDAERYARSGLLEWRRLARLSGAAERVSELILAAAGEGIYGVDLEGRTTFANPAAERMLGWRLEDLVGRTMHHLIHHTRADGGRYPEAECPIYDAFRSAKVTRVEDELFWRKDGKPIRVEYTSTPIIDQGEVQGAVIVFRDITERKVAEARLREALDEVAALKQRLQMENEYLQEEVRAQSAHSEILGRSAAIGRILEQVALVAPTTANVLITGESGSGKELVAQAIHKESGRAERPLIRVNCAAIPRELFESEFFGHAKGAFTGALQDRAGRFELADGGTLFLDEVGELPLELQGKLLRVLQEGSFERIGESRTRKCDVRLIAATNRDLAAEAKAGRFREDLFFRLDVFPIQCPPLRERPEDIPLLAEAFLDVACARLGMPRPKLTRAAVAQLEAYDWPGNARELQNVIERAVILSRGGKLVLDLRTPSRGADEPPRVPPPAYVTEAERKARDQAALNAALAAANGKVSGPGGAAERLGVKPSTLYSRLRRRNRRPEP